MDKNNEYSGDKEIVSEKGMQEELKDLKEDVDQNTQSIPLSEIGEFNNEGNFVIKDEIIGEDENGKYIEIRGIKYYDDSCRSKLDDECPGYSISKLNNGVCVLYIGLFENGTTQKSGTEYHSNGTLFKGEWENGAKSHGFEVLLDGNTFYGDYNEYGQPTYGTFKKYKDGEIDYTYTGGIDVNWKKQGQGKCIWQDGNQYEGEWLDGKYNGYGKFSFSSGNQYEGERLDGKKNGHGTYSYRDGHSLDGERVNGDFKEGKGIEIQKNGEIYEGDFLLDKNGVIKPFYIAYTDWKTRQISEGNTQALSNIKMEGKRTLPNGSIHEYKLTNGSISEKANDFITMYDDKKPNEDRSKERGNIEYTINYSSDSHVEYKMNSRKRSISWKLEGGFHQFTNKKGDTLSFKRTSELDDKKAMHLANLINKIRYTNQNAHGNRAYKYDKINLYATDFQTQMCPGPGAVLHEQTYEAKGTVLLGEVSKKTGGISAESLANRLNGC